VGNAGHTMEDLKVALEKLREVAELLHLRYALTPFG
jgi:hypothetical protein